MQYNRKCYLCGKPFYIGCALDWVYKYKEHYNNGAYKCTNYFCSWHCFREYEKSIPRLKYNPDTRHYTKRG